MQAPVAPVGPAIDAVFRIQGTELPADHAAPLYASISRAVPSLHQNPALGIFPINGQHMPNRRMLLTDRSRLTLRLPADQLGNVLELAGSTLEIAGRHVLLGVPRVRVHTPHEELTSRLVVIKGFMEPETLSEAVQRQLDEMGCQGQPSLVSISTTSSREGGVSRPEGAPVRRTLRIHGREIVGFAVRISALAPRDSLLLQAQGIGGRRRYGCGLFVPLRSR